MILLDSTGVKVTNRGEWTRRKRKIHNGWIKVHISLDDKGKQVVGPSVTDDGTHDTREFGGLMEQSVENAKNAGGKKVTQAKGDGAYDSGINFDRLEKLGIAPCIKIGGGAEPRAASKNPRKKYAKEVYELGYKRWRDKYGYGKRWYVEVPHSVVKRKCGEYVHATKNENMYRGQAEVLFYNTLLKYDACRMLPWHQNHATPAHS